MTIQELEQVASDLKQFVGVEMGNLTLVTGVNKDSVKTVTRVVSDVVKKLDAVKLQFKDVTNEQLHDLAVDSVLELLMFLLSSRLGAVGRWLFLVIPLSIKRQIAGLIVDIVVSLVHPTTGPGVSID